MPNTELDTFDRRILDALQTDGRMTNSDLAENIGLSPSPCLRRVRQLESKGVISGYVALVDPQTIGLSVSAFVRVRLDQQDDQHLRTFETAISEFPEVMECYLMSGDADYQLRVMVESLNAFEDFLRNKLTTIGGVAQVTTSFALRPIIYKTALPLGH
jgi:Lrp/AsnC family leucine-responsive transcriptional regulator